MQRLIEAYTFHLNHDNDAAQLRNFATLLETLAEQIDREGWVDPKGRLTPRHLQVRAEEGRMRADQIELARPGPPPN